MKQLIKAGTHKNFAALVMFSFIQTILWAQDSTSTTTTTSTTVTKETTWYAQPWVWIVGGAVLILLLVALLRGGGPNKNTASRTDKVTVTKTTDRDVS